MKANREQLLAVLDSVAPGLSKREVLEQSSCFVLQNGYATSFNDEISCRRKSGLDKELTGAVRAEKLLEQLRKWNDDEIDLVPTDKALIIKGGRKETGITMEAEITLPVDTVERPTTWTKLPDDFLEAVGVIHQVASTDENNSLRFVHVHPRWLEGCDNFQFCRWPMKTGVKKSIHLRRDSIKHVTDLGMTEFSETEGWMHYRNPSGLELSIRRYLEDYPDLSGVLEVTGETVTLPKGLAEACDKAAVFSAENPDANQVSVEIKSGRLTVKGESASGWFTQRTKLRYTGKPMSFRASPVILQDLVKRWTDCVLGKGRLKVEAGSYTYILHLFVPETVTESEEMPEEEKETVKKRLQKAEVGDEE